MPTTTDKSIPANGVLGDGLKPIEHKMKFKAVMVTPTVAAEWLKHRHPQQRKPKDHKINQYSSDMAYEFWELTHQAVAFDEDGWLIDGQNRLEACKQANVPVPMLIVTGVPRAAMIALDCGLARNVVDAARVKGVPLPHGAVGYASVARRMMYGSRKPHTAATNQELLAFIEAHRRALDFAFEALPHNVRFLTQAGVRAVLARAYYRRPVEETRARLLEFGNVFATGLPDNPKKDSAAIRLRNWLLEQFSGRRGAGVRPEPTMVCAKTATALHHFLAHEEVQSLKETSKELFPISGESEGDA